MYVFSITDTVTVEKKGRFSLNSHKNYDKFSISVAKGLTPAMHSFIVPIWAVQDAIAQLGQVNTFVGPKAGNVIQGTLDVYLFGTWKQSKKGQIDVD